MSNCFKLYVTLYVLMNSLHATDSISYEKYAESLSELRRFSTLRTDSLSQGGIKDFILPHLLIIRTYIENLQYELQSITLSINTSLHNSAAQLATHTQIAARLSNLVPAKETVYNESIKEKNPKKNTSLTQCLKILDKYEKVLHSSKAINHIEEILTSIIPVVDGVEKEVIDLGRISQELSFAQIAQARDMFNIALRFYKLTGIEGQTGPYISDDFFQTTE